MPYFPELAELTTESHPQRRRHPRCPLRTLAYVRLEDQANGGVIRDLTESGIAIQAVMPLETNREFRLSFDLLTPRLHVETAARVAWADTSGQAGIQFLGLALRTQRAIRDWLLRQMLSAAAITGRDSIFRSLEPQLIVSAESRPPIVIESAKEEVPSSPRIHWGTISISARSFSLFLDSVVLLCAILIFSISAIGVMGAMPEWPLAGGLFGISSLIFLAVYQLLFSELLWGATPGRRLALLASLPHADEPVTRFR
jgi:PilZ domain